MLTSCAGRDTVSLKIPAKYLVPCVYELKPIESETIREAFLEQEETILEQSLVLEVCDGQITSIKQYQDGMNE